MVNVYILTGVVLSVVIITTIIYKKSSLIERNPDMVNKQTTAAIVFDLDQTLGEFTELSMFIESVGRYREERGYTPLTTAMKFEIFDLFPQVFRPDIFKIIQNINTNINTNINKSTKIYMYTNNQGDKEWPQLIADYFQHKLGYKVFEYVIAAFKNYKNIQVEQCRTTQEKTTEDFFACTKLPINKTQICFVDDLVHPRMRTNNVYYININPYHFSYPFADMAAKYYNMVSRKEIQNKSTNSATYPTIDAGFNQTIIAYMKQYTNYPQSTLKSSSDDAEEQKISKYLKHHIKVFLSTH